MTNFTYSPVRLTLLVVFLHLALTRESAAAEVPIQPVQSALKKRGFYQGEPTGRLDESTRGALKRFQIRNGLETTGEPDRATVEALRKEESSPAEAALEPSIRERARDLVRSDKEFLETVEILDQADAPPPTETPQRPPTVVKSELTVRRSAPAPAPVGSAPEPVRPAPADDEASGPILAEEVQHFVEEYLRVAQGETPDSEVALYADQVDYFDSGRVSRKVVANDQRSYYRRWPSRKFTLLAEPKIERASDRAATVRFRMRYALRSGTESASGQTENVLRVKRTDSGLRIAGINERKVND